MLILRKTTLPDGATFKALPSAVERYQALYPNPDRTYVEACLELAELVSVACETGCTYTNPKRDNQIVAYADLKLPAWLVLAESQPDDDVTHVIITMLAHKDKDFADEFEDVCA